MSDKAARAAEYLAREGVESYDVFRLRTEELAIEVKEGETEAATRAVEEGLALRAVIEGRLGSAFTYELTDQALAQAARQAAELARVSDPDEDQADPEYLTGPGGEYPTVETVDPSLAGLDREVRAEVALRLERAALDYDPRVKKVRTAAYEEARSEARLINSRGLELAREATLCSVSIALLAEAGGESQMGYDFSYSRFFDKLEVEECGRRAAAEAVGRLGAKQAKTGRFPALIENLTATQILSVLAPAFLAESVRKGKSMLAGKEGRKIFSEIIEIRDDGLYPSGAGTRPFDDEGTPQMTTPLVAEGVLQGFLYDRAEAIKAGREPTGNGRRGGLKSPPSGGPSNLLITPGENDLEELTGRISDGFLITELMGLHTADPISGDFSLGAMGYWIESGKRAFPVQGGAISGNLMDLFERVVAVGSDLRQMGSVGAPCLLLDHLDIAG